MDGALTVLIVWVGLPLICFLVEALADRRGR